MHFVGSLLIEQVPQVEWHISTFAHVDDNVSVYPSGQIATQFRLTGSAKFGEQLFTHESTLSCL